MSRLTIEKLLPVNSPYTVVHRDTNKKFLSVRHLIRRSMDLSKTLFYAIRHSACSWRLLILPE